jgi:hypothetical protein
LHALLDPTTNKVGLTTKRLAELLKETGIDASDATVSRYERAPADGGRIAGVDYVIGLVHLAAQQGTRVSWTWLMTGEGEPDRAEEGTAAELIDELLAAVLVLRNRFVHGETASRRRQKQQHSALLAAVARAEAMIARQSGAGRRGKAGGNG